MADRLTPAERSRNMSRIRGADTKPELLARAFLHRAGIRFRLHRRDLPGRPDIVVPRSRTAIFVHGCYWHRHPGCELTTTPKTNARFWQRKFSENVERDRKSHAALRRLGWHVEVIWECELALPETLPRVTFELLVRRDAAEENRTVVPRRSQ